VVVVVVVGCAAKGLALSIKTPRLWFGLIVRRSTYRGGVQILAEIRDFSLLHDFHICSGTLLASWFVEWEGENVLFNDAVVLFNDAVVLFNDAVVLFNDAFCC
jgi:hypothetical protein